VRLYQTPEDTLVFTTITFIIYSLLYYLRRDELEAMFESPTAMGFVVLSLLSCIVGDLTRAIYRVVDEVQKVKYRLPYKY
jgi:hypothetical protein